MINKRR